MNPSQEDMMSLSFSGADKNFPEAGVVIFLSQQAIHFYYRLLFSGGSLPALWQLFCPPTENIL
jgi:hypothetical protein